MTELGGGPPEPLALAYPVLSQLRGGSSWWRLQSVLSDAVLDPTEVDVALDALVRLDRSWGDQPGADTHRAFHRSVRRALEIGVPAAFQERLDAARRDLPPTLRSQIAQVDEAAASYLADGDVASLLRAEAAWIDVARSDDVEYLAPGARLSMMCDATVLHQEVVDMTGDVTVLGRLIDDLELAVSLFRPFQAHPPACRLDLDPRLQSVTGRLALALRSRFDRTGDRSHLELASKYLRATLDLTPAAAPDHAWWVAAVGVTLSHAGADGLADAVEAFAAASASEPRGSALRITCLALRGRGLRALHQATDDPTRLDAAVQAFRTAMEETPPPPGSLLPELTAVLLNRFVAGGHGDDLDEGTALLARCSSTSVDHPAPRTRQTPASRLLSALAPILPTAGPDLVDAALSVLERLGSDPAAEEVAERLSRLAGLLLIWSGDHSGTSHLDRRVRLFEVALALDPGGSKTAEWLNDLAVALDSRYARLGRAEDLGAAISAARQAVAASQDDRARSGCANTLGGLLARRFGASGGMPDLAEAVAAFEAATKTTEGTTATPAAERAGFLSNLAAALRMRAGRRGWDGDLERAAGAATEAVALVEAGPPAVLALALGTAAAVRHDRWRLGGTQDDLDAAIADWRRAVPLAAPARTPVLRQNVGSALLDRYQLGLVDADLDQAIEMLAGVLPDLAPHLPDRALAEGRLAEALHARGLSRSDPQDLELATWWSREAVGRAAGTSPETQLRTAWDWGRRAEADGSWDEAAEAYSHALDAVRELVEASPFRADKEAWLAVAFGVPTRAAHAHARSGDPTAAVVALEVGRGLLLADALGVVDDRIASLASGENAEIHARYAAAAARWGSLARRGDLPAPGSPAGSGAPTPTPREVEAARGELLHAAGRLRACPGLEDVVTAPSYADLSRAASGTLLYLVPGVTGGLALLVGPDSSVATCVALPALDQSSVGDRVLAFHSASERADEDPGAWELALERLTRWLGDALAPAFDAVGGARLVLVPTGALELLPLHAAWREDAEAVTGRRYALDDRVMSLAPTALSLLAARNRAAAPVPHPALLAVSNPAPSHEVPLPFAAAEVAAALTTLPGGALLDGAAATVAAVSSRLPGCDVAHFACHGRAVIDRPRSSGLLLGEDAMLTVDHIARMGLTRPRLVVLSACETFVPGAGAPGEVIGLATTLLGAGVNSVVCSLWTVLDISSLLVVVRFYELLFSESDDLSDGGEPAQALIGAQRWVRDTTNGEKLRHWAERRDSGRLPAQTYHVISGELAGLEPAARDFASPVNWAAFTVTGR